MTVQHSFSKIEKELLPAFRQQIGSAESTEDVKKFFVHTIQELVRMASDGALMPRYEDIRLHHVLESEGEPRFGLGENLMTDPQFVSVWSVSDLPHIVDRFATSACNRYKHLEKNPEKTEAKIRM